jgi:hypothetical protein
LNWRGERFSPSPAATIERHGLSVLRSYFEFPLITHAAQIPKTLAGEAKTEPLRSF